MFEFEQRKLPNATIVLVLGILSIITCCCYGILGLIIGIIALVLYKQDKRLYDANPSVYTNFSNLNTGRILAIIGLVLNILFLFYIIWAISFIGWETLQNPELLQEKLNELQ
ncbi:hypothetical protein BTO06_09380 [Tenacibaculum sp. SZ-18]|uniref:CCC motif membrane protein n=1 Tax=Tenacibaculum sp. SZ-18 TaxID=754423 RepID=UPI000C2D16E8|nr:CCC motif membrane protein [Tenacibaculum sp. SZ-18]AUC15338.1 hypothetical protein BTO06_09380 [Tenacibaculum sp. SZ-18]